MVEWLKAPVLKTGDMKVSVGSNPTLSAKKKCTPCGCISFWAWMFVEWDSNKNPRPRREAGEGLRENWFARKIARIKDAFGISEEMPAIWNPTNDAMFYGFCRVGLAFQ